VTRNMRAMGGVKDSRLKSEESLEGQHVCLSAGIRVGYR
jgi:hypothetical protein